MIPNVTFALHAKKQPHILYRVVYWDGRATAREQQKNVGDVKWSVHRPHSATTAEIYIKCM